MNNNLVKYSNTNRINTLEIYDGNENMILGLVWVLILHFQIVKKAEVMEWIKKRTNKYLSDEGLPLVEKVEKRFVFKSKNIKYCAQRIYFFLLVFNMVKPFVH